MQAQTVTPIHCVSKEKEDHTHLITQSLCLPISRPHVFECWMAAIRAQDLDWRKIEILCLIDNPDPDFTLRVLKAFEEWYTGPRLRLWRVCLPYLPEKSHARERRERIAGLWKFLVENAAGAFLLGMEDDSLPLSSDCFSKLLEVLWSRTDIGFVQGTIVARWGVPFIPHWRITPNYVTTAIVYLGPEQVVEIDGGGWFCFAARKKAFEAFNWEWTDDYPTGPDVACTVAMKAAGWSLLGHWGLEIEHLTDGKSLIPSQETELKVLELNRRQDGMWVGRPRPMIGLANRNISGSPKEVKSVRQVRVRALQHFFWRENYFKGAEMAMDEDVAHEHAQLGYVEILGPVTEGETLQSDNTFQEEPRQGVRGVGPAPPPAESSADNFDLDDLDLGGEENVAEDPKKGSKPAPSRRAAESAVNKPPTDLVADPDVDQSDVQEPKKPGKGGRPKKR